MKFVFKRDCFNSPELVISAEALKTAGSPHANVIPKGFRHVVGGDAETVEGMTNPSDRKLATKLLAFECAVFDSGTAKSRDVIKKIDNEVAAEKEAATLAKADAPKSLAAQVVEAVLAAQAALAKPVEA